LYAVYVEESVPGVDANSASMSDDEPDDDDDELDDIADYFDDLFSQEIDYDN
jgi:hypothetical protein